MYRLVMKSRKRGYLLVELALFIGLLAVLSTHGVVLAHRKFEDRQIDYVVQIFNNVAQLCLAFRARHGRWPFTEGELVHQLDLSHKLRLYNGLDSRVFLDIHRTEVFTGLLTLKTTMPTDTMAARLRLRLGHMAWRFGREVKVHFPIPGTEHSHSALLPLEGNRAMDGSLNMDGHGITGLSGINLEGGAPAAGVIRWQNEGRSARLVVDELWVNRIQVKDLTVRRLNWGGQTPTPLPREVDY